MFCLVPSSINRRNSSRFMFAETFSAQFTPTGFITFLTGPFLVHSPHQDKIRFGEVKEVQSRVSGEIRKNFLYFYTSDFISDVSPPNHLYNQPNWQEHQYEHLPDYCFNDILDAHINLFVCDIFRNTFGRIDHVAKSSVHFLDVTSGRNRTIVFSCLEKCHLVLA